MSPTYQRPTVVSVNNTPIPFHSIAGTATSPVGGSRIAPSTIARVLAGAAAGSVCAVVCSPLDVARTRLQVQATLLPATGGAVPAARPYTGLLSALHRIGAEEGIRGFFSGYGTAAIIVPTFWMTFFPVYELLKNRAAVSLNRDTQSPLVHVAASVGAAVTVDTLTNPLWVVRTRLQTQALHQIVPQRGEVFYRGTAHALRTIARQEGVGALFKGLTASYVGASHVAIQFPAYEYMQVKLRERNGGEELGAPELIFASSLSKVVASFLTYPHEVLRARLQDQRDSSTSRPYRGLVHACRSMLRNEGWASLYAGFSANLVRAVPACAVTFTTYSVVMRELRERGIIDSADV